MKIQGTNKHTALELLLPGSAPSQPCATPQSRGGSEPEEALPRAGRPQPAPTLSTAGPRHQARGWAWAFCSSTTPQPPPWGPVAPKCPPLSPHEGLTPPARGDPTCSRCLCLSAGLTEALLGAGGELFIPAGPSRFTPLSAAPAAAPGPQCFKSSGKVFSRAEQSSSGAPNTVPQGSVTVPHTARPPS